MIITHKDIDNINIKIGKTQILSNEYSFIPINIKNINNLNSVLQTPYMYIPYGIKNIDDKKKILDISFLNISNDTNLSLFYDFLKIIENKVYKK
jgi:hypothetical protein